MEWYQVLHAEARALAQPGPPTTLAARLVATQQTSAIARLRLAARSQLSALSFLGFRSSRISPRLITPSAPIHSCASCESRRRHRQRSHQAAQSSGSGLAASGSRRGWCACRSSATSVCARALAASDPSRCQLTALACTPLACTALTPRRQEPCTHSAPAKLTQRCERIAQEPGCCSAALIRRDTRVRARRAWCCRAGRWLR